jgi:hypothetical protein
MSSRMLDVSYWLLLYKNRRAVLTAKSHVCNSHARCHTDFGHGQDTGIHPGFARQPRPPRDVSEPSGVAEPATAATSTPYTTT